MHGQPLSLRLAVLMPVPCRAVCVLCVSSPFTSPYPCTAWGLLVYGLLVFCMEFLPFGAVNPPEVAEYFTLVGGGGVDDVLGGKGWQPC